MAEHAAHGRPHQGGRAVWQGRALGSALALLSHHHLLLRTHILLLIRHLLLLRVGWGLGAGGASPAGRRGDATVTVRRSINAVRPALLGP